MFLGIILYDKTINDIPYKMEYHHQEVLKNEYRDFNVTHSITPKKGRVLFLMEDIIMHHLVHKKSMNVIIIKYIWK